MRIILSRHGRSAYDPPRRIANREFTAVAAEYLRAGIRRPEQIPSSTIEEAYGARLIVTSDIARAVESAVMLKPQSLPEIDPVFREAEIPLALPLPGSASMSPSAWVIIRRIFWICGWTGGAKSLRSTLSRAARASDRLQQLAEVNGTVMLVGHQLFNFFLGQRLRATGWVGPIIPKSSHWSCSIYDKVTTTEGTDSTNGRPTQT